MTTPNYTFFKKKRANNGTFCTVCNLISVSHGGKGDINHHNETNSCHIQSMARTKATYFILFYGIGNDVSYHNAEEIFAITNFFTLNKVKQNY